MNDGRTDVVIVSNSPGEVFTWVRIIAEQMKKMSPVLRIIVTLVPCPYATGREVQVAESYPSVDLVISPQQFLSYMILGKLPPEYKPASRGIVVFLGGDLWHAAGLAWKLKYPAIAYAARPRMGWANRFKYFLCPDETVSARLVAKGLPREKIKVVGHLTVESVKPTASREECFSSRNLNPNRFTVGIFPGSRLYNLQDSLPVFLKAAEEIHREEPDTQFLLGVSPFRSLDEIRSCLDNPNPPIPGIGGKMVDNGSVPGIVTDGGVTVHVLEAEPSDVISMADIVLTIPGTNTAECAYMGRPMVVASSWKARVPPVGLGMLINLLPKGNLRRSLVLYMVNKLKYTALPNIIAQRPVTPEIMVENSSEEISLEALKLIRDNQGREKMSEELKKIMGASGAAEQVVNMILDVLKEEESRSPAASAGSEIILEASQQKDKIQSLKDFMFRYRGWLFVPSALVMLFLAKPSLISMAVGFLLAIIGEGIRMWAVGYTGATTRDSEVKAPQLVTAGPYAHLRNPLYLGNLISWLGFCVAASGAAPLWEKAIIFISVIVSYAIIYSFVISHEEGFLKETFGAPFREYLASVPRLIPRLKPYEKQNGKYDARVIVNAEIHTVIMLVGVAAVIILKFLKIIPI